MAEKAGTVIMVAFTNLLQYVGYSTDIISAAAGVWYTSAEIMERNLKRDARPVAYLVTEPPPVAERPPRPIPGPSAGSAKREPGWLLRSMIERADQPYVPAKLPPPEPALRPLSTGLAGDEEEIEPEAEKLLMAKLAGFADFLWGLATGSLGGSGAGSPCSAGSDSRSASRSPWPDRRGLGAALRGAPVCHRRLSPRQR